MIKYFRPTPRKARWILTRTLSRMPATDMETPSSSPGLTPILLRGTLVMNICSLSNLRLECVCGCSVLFCQHHKNMLICKDCRKYAKDGKAKMYNVAATHYVAFRKLILIKNSLLSKCLKMITLDVSTSIGFFIVTSRTFDGIFGA